MTRRIVVGLFAIFVTGFLSPSMAWGDTHPHSWSIVTFEGITHYGTYAEFHNNNMTVRHAEMLHFQRHFVLHHIWAASGGLGCTQYWVEAGVNQRVDPKFGLIAYYHAVNKMNQWGYQEFLDAYTVPDGTNHSYYIKYKGGATYSAYRDGQFKLSVGGMGFGTCRSDAGLEMNLPVDGRTHSDTFDFNPLKYQDTSYNWQTGWPLYRTAVDWPCGVFVPPGCLNGAHYSNSYWADNKPCHGYFGCTAP